MNWEQFLTNFIASFLGSTVAILLTLYLHRKTQKGLDRLKRSIYYQFKKLEKKTNDKTN